MGFIPVVEDISMCNAGPCYMLVNCRQLKTLLGASAEDANDPNCVVNVGDVKFLLQTMMINGPFHLSEAIVLRMKVPLLMAVVLLVRLRNGEQTIMSCPESDYALELRDFHIIDQNTASDVHKLKVYQENLLEITGTLITNVPVTANSFTATVRLNLNGERYLLGMPFIVNQPVDCPESLSASSSDPKQCVITAVCDGLAAILGAAETFSCQPLSGVIYFRASGLTVPPVEHGVIPNTVTNAWNPKVQIKIEIYTDGGTMISCISEELLLDIES